jgi:hypothetical protein
MANGTHRSAELEREVEAQRSRVQSTIGELQERLTPGELVDEVLSYTKHGGAHFASNLGQTVTANPLPAALLGISLAWLFAGPKLPMGNGHANGSYTGGSNWDGRAHGSAEPIYGRISGRGLTRTSHAMDDSGAWYSDFQDTSGLKYRAKSSADGHRAGHFVDDAGKAVSGFIDDTGRHVTEFRDEAGNLLDQAGGWANHTWHDVQDAVGQQAAGTANSAMQMGTDMQQNAARMTRDAISMLEEQPLVMGALAFAAGAALGAALPPTKQEDEMIGEVADEVKDEAAEAASNLYEQGKEKAAEVYEDASEKAGEIYGDAKRKLTGAPQPSAAGQPASRNGQQTHH